MSVKQFQIEFYHKTTEFDTKTFDTMPYIPMKGEVAYLECENPEMNDIGKYFTVMEVRSLFFSTKTLRQTVQVFLDPAPHTNGQTT